MSTWVFGAERWDNLIYYALGGHKDAIVACFFESSSLDVRPCTQSPQPTGISGHSCKCGTHQEAVVLGPPLGPPGAVLRPPGGIWELTVAAGSPSGVFSPSAQGQALAELVTLRQGSCPGLLWAGKGQGSGAHAHTQVLPFAAVHAQPRRSLVRVAV